MAQTPEFKDFIPGMEFFQTLLKGSGMPGQFANWVAPTLDVAEIEQKITDLKAVLSWLETNARMTQNMVQALEVQRMTLQALKSMNVDLQAFAQKVAEPAGGTAAAQGQTTAPPLFDPMQWWTGMTQQFTELTAKALQDGFAAAPVAAAAAAAAAPGATQQAAAAAAPRGAAAEKAGAEEPGAQKAGAKKAGVEKAGIKKVPAKRSKPRAKPAGGAA